MRQRLVGNILYTLQTVDIEIDISANHWGHFELKLCPVSGKTEEATQVRA